MATYFDPALPADVALLAPSVQSSSRLTAVSEQVEAELIERYREFVGYDYRPQGWWPVEIDVDGYAVMLRGYTTDADDAEPRFKDAFRRTIADVISFRLLHESEDDRVLQETRGRRSVTYRKGSRTGYPSGSWAHRLHKYNLRPTYVW